MARSRVLAVEWWWWSSGGRTSGGDGRITTLLSVVSTHQCCCRLSRAVPSPATAPPPAAPSLVSTSINFAVWTRRRLCLSCRRASSCRSIVISVVVDVVIVGLDINVIGGFDASAKPFVPPPHLLPSLHRRCHRCRCCRYHRHCHSPFVDVNDVLVLVVVVVIIVVLVIIVVVRLHCRCRCPVIIAVVVVVVIAFG